MNFVQIETYRWVNNNDIVARVPPAWLGYRHKGEEIYLNAFGQIRQLTTWQRIKDRWRGFVRGLKRGEHEASGQADLALRYDLTVPLARVVAAHQAELPKYFKRYQIQPVWRADRPSRGRFREFYQCDVDAMGSTAPVVEAEVMAAVADVLTTLGFDDFRIRLNDRQLLRALLAAARQ